MSLYRICRVLLVGLLIASLVYPRVGDAIPMVPDTVEPTAMMSQPLPAEPCDDERPAIRLTLACKCAFFAVQPVEIDMRISMIALKIRMSTDQTHPGEPIPYNSHL